MKKGKLIGRVGVQVSDDTGSEYISYRLHVFAKAEHALVHLRYTAQANRGEDCAYALALDGGQSLRLDAWEAQDGLALAARLHSVYLNQSAPRARLIDGKAVLDECELSRFLQGAEKLGLHVSRFTESGKAYDWARALDEEAANANPLSA
jgi:hypothetical protein